MSHEVLIQQLNELPDFQGFIGVNCHNCNASLNVLLSVHFICPGCNSFNSAPREKQPLHQIPDFGFSAEQIEKHSNQNILAGRWDSLSDQEKKDVLTEIFNGNTLQISVLYEYPLGKLLEELNAEEIYRFQNLLRK